MPKPTEGNPPSTGGRLMKQAAAARFIGVHRQYIPVMIGQGELETEDVDGVPHVIRTSAEKAKASREARRAKQPEKPKKRHVA